MNIRKRQGELHSVTMDMNLLPETASNIQGDGKNVALLCFLYTLQGIPLGLSAAIPMLLQNRGVSYREQAEFSFVNWPFSMKLLWAPIVDSLFLPWLGRRKTWLIPTQYLLGITMFILSTTVNQWLGDEDTSPNIGVLTAAFFFLNFLAATQDIAVDGWALTMLQKRNVGHASTCNSIGQTTGYFLGYVLFMALESADFCNNYLRDVPQSEGIVTLSGFFYFWSIVFLVTTTLVALLKHETPGEHHEPEEEMDIRQAYTTLWKIVNLPPIRLLILILLTAKIGFSATDAVSGLKLVEGGLPKEKLGLMAVPLIPLEIVLVFGISKWTSGPRPMDIFLKAVPYRLLFGFAAAALVWVTPYLVFSGHIPTYYYLILLFIYGIHRVLANSMFVANMAFFAKISDPAVGGTYMTLLNTLCNLGGVVPSTVALWMVDSLTWRSCDGAKEHLPGNTCSSLDERKVCTELDGHCNTLIDGFYLETIICVVLGFIWLMWVKRKVQKLQSLPDTAWKVNKVKKSGR